MAVAVDTVAPTVIGGVDTHKDVHVAAALDHLGRLLGTAEFPTTAVGYRALLAWLAGFGEVERIGVEGTGAWGAGLSRFLRASGIVVIEVDRPNRQRRRRRGKSDATDAESAGRAVLAGDVSGIPKAQDGLVESIRMLRVAQRSAERARTQAANQLHSLLDTAPASLREQLRILSLRDLADRASRFRPGANLSDPTIAFKAALRSLARRWLSLSDEIKLLERQLAQLVRAVAPPPLMGEFGVGPDVAGALLVAAGDNPERLHSEASFAALCGASPLDASSGRQHRHRLNRGGNREANAALWRIVMVRLRWNHPETRAYVDRRVAAGKTRREAIRCLKRYLARRIWRLLTQATRPAAAP
jgi:transposase